MNAELQGRIEEGADRYADADPAELARIATEADRFAEKSERTGIEEGYAYSAAQTEYGCAWEWGDGSEVRDASGNLVIDDDDEPCARVYDCDGETIGIVR